MSGVEERVTPWERNEDEKAVPFFLSSTDRPLYAVYHPPARYRAEAPVVVHCHTLGVEQLTSCRTEALSARAAASLGYPALRYHSRGHGDSAGDFADVTLEGLVEDAHAACEEARRRSGARRVVWLGVRFGALVAATALAQSREPAGLVLWEPVTEPQDYFRRMLRGVLYSQVAKGRRPDTTVDDMLARVEEQGMVDVHGYYLHRKIVRTSWEVTLEERLGAWQGPTLVVQVQERRSVDPAHARLVAALEQRGAAVSLVQVREEPAWHFVSNPAWEGSEVVRRTAEWLDALA